MSTTTTQFWCMFCSKLLLDDEGAMCNDCIYGPNLDATELRLEEETSPTDFDAGGHSLAQNTVNFDFSKYYDDVLSGMNLAFGAEYRTEQFMIYAGEEGSYGTYSDSGILITDPETQFQPIDPITGDKNYEEDNLASKIKTYPNGPEALLNYQLANPNAKFRD